MSEISEINEKGRDVSDESIDADFSDELDSNYESYLQEGKKSENTDTVENYDDTDEENEIDNLDEELDRKYDEYISSDKTDIGEEKERYIEDSGWSQDIVEKIDSDEQYDIYKNAELHEEEVNGRKCLVKDIDYDYIDEKTGMTNKELMEKGRSPIDSKTGEKIELHHMGQDYDSPFAELDENSEHGNGNHKILHPKTDNSWRNNEELKNQYQIDRKEHWKQRSTEA